MRLVFEAANSRDITDDDLDDLADFVRSALPNDSTLEVETRTSQEFGAGLGWEDILDVILPAIPAAIVFRDALVGIALDRSITWMRKRFAKKHEGSRVRVIRVYDPSGNLLRVYTIESADAQPTITPRDVEDS